jgi:HSP20 family molecular chaperone IbpA
MPVELTCQACKLQIADNKLTIKGKLPGRAAAEAEEVIGERHAFTSFDRTFRLWDDIDASKITAKLVTALASLLSCLNVLP